MHKDYLPDSLAKILDSIQTPPREARQEQIEASIYAFKPNAEEAQEILAMLVAAVEQRYGPSSDMNHYAKWLAAAFYRVAGGMTLDDDQDEAYDAYRQRRDDDANG